MSIKFKGQTINGEWVSGLLANSHGLQGQPPKGWYINNRVGQPWANPVRPETIELIEYSKITVEVEK